MKQWIAGGLIIGLTLLCGCSAWETVSPQKQKNQPVGEQPTSPILSPSMDMSEKFYSGILPYLPNQTRGALSQYGSRIDASHLEWGLLEYAKASFPPHQFLFQEGQVLGRNDISGLEKKHPPLIHILEHDYIKIDKRKREGMVLGISLDPRYKDEAGNRMAYTDKELKAKGEAIAQEVEAVLQKREPDTPVLFLVYRTEPSSSMIPGRFICLGKSKGDQENTSLTWTNIDEHFYLLPGDEAKDTLPQVAAQFAKFQKSVQAFFQNYIGVTALARVEDNKLAELTITANAEYDSRTEVIQFTQYAASLLPESFDSKAHINLYVQTIDKPLAIYIRPASGEPIFHVYRN